MSGLDLEPIRERDAHDWEGRWAGEQSMSGGEAVEDRRALLAEVDHLRSHIAVVDAVLDAS